MCPAVAARARQGLLCSSVIECCTDIARLGSQHKAQWTRQIKAAKLKRGSQLLFMCLCCHACVLQWLLRPVHAKWSEARWLAHLDSPGAFASEYMQHEVLAGGAVVVGSRWVADPVQVNVRCV
jgi:hypothetical protein